MRYSIQLSKRAQKDLDKLAKTERARIIKALQRLESDPQLGYPLIGELKGKWKLRIRVYRIIYIIRRQELLILVVTVGHRKEVYKGGK